MSDHPTFSPCNRNPKNGKIPTRFFCPLISESRGTNNIGLITEKKKRFEIKLLQTDFKIVK